MSKGSHDYLSTACFHGLHQRCRKHCKFCDVPCKCQCHAAATVERDLGLAAPASGEADAPDATDVEQRHVV